MLLNGRVAMKRRMIVLMLAMIVALSVSAPAAFGWSNGPDLNGDGLGDDGFGTHDWVLDNAITMAGTGGQWIDREKALLASDDPDTLRTDSAYHLFRDQGIGRGAPAAVADLYSKAVDAYKVGDIKKASEYVGVLSHYYSDILQPFHTDYRALSYDTLHGEYELAVDTYTRKPGDRADWVSQRAYVPVTDVRAKTVSAAYYSRTKYPALVSALLSSHNNIANATVNSITGSVLSRASNDLADIVRTIPTAAGVAQPPAKMTGSRMSIYYPASTGKVSAATTCLDAAGKPIEGAVVYFTWPLKAGPKTVKAYTDAKGYAYYWQVLDGMPLMKVATVNISSPGASKSTTSSTWFMPTPLLADGAAGIKTSVSSARPRQNSTVTVSTVVHDRAGHAVVGLPVTFTWSFKSATYTMKTVTNSSGIARCSRNIGYATKGYRVYVRAQTQSGGYRRSSTASFVTE